MALLPEFFPAVTGFEWDEGNSVKLWRRHSVTQSEAEQIFMNLDRYGNTSAASVAIALDEAVATGRVQRGDLVLLVVFGAGLTWGAAVIEW